MGTGLPFFLGVDPAAAVAACGCSDLRIVSSKGDRFFFELVWGAIFLRMVALGAKGLDTDLAGLDGGRAEPLLKRARTREVTFWFCSVKCGWNVGIPHLEMHFVVENETEVRKDMAALE